MSMRAHAYLYRHGECEIVVVLNIMGERLYY